MGKIIFRQTYQIIKSRSRKEPHVFGPLEPEPLEKKNQEPEQLEKKWVAGAGKKLAGSPALALVELPAYAFAWYTCVEQDK